MYLSPTVPLKRVRAPLLSNSPYGNLNPALQNTGLGILHSITSKLEPLAVGSISTAVISPLLRLVEVEELELDEPDLEELEEELLWLELVDDETPDEL